MSFRLIAELPAGQAVGRSRARGLYTTRASAAAGRSRTARQLPNEPATRPPAIASATARTTALMLTGVVRCTETVCAAAAGRPNPPVRWFAVPVVAVSGGTSAWTAAGGA